MRHQIELVSTHLLKEYPVNAKKHPKAQIDAIARSIQEFGFNVPIIIDEHGEIIAGHGRYLAAKQLEFAQVPCIRLNDLSDAQIRAFRLADNKISTMGDVDMEKVVHELTALNAEGLDVSLTGFDPSVLDIDTEKVKKSLKFDVTQTVTCPHCGRLHEIKR